MASRSSFFIAGLGYGTVLPLVESAVLERLPDGVRSPSGVGIDRLRRGGDSRGTRGCGRPGRSIPADACSWDGGCRDVLRAVGAGRKSAPASPVQVRSRLL